MLLRIDEDNRKKTIRPLLLVVTLPHQSIAIDFNGFFILDEEVV